MDGNESKGNISDTNTLLKYENITLVKLKSFFDSALLNTEITSENTLKVEDDWIKVNVRVNKDWNLIVFSASWNLKSSVQEIKKLQLANKINEKLIVIRASVLNQNILYCDYYVSYKGGITHLMIINNYRLFNRVFRSTFDKDDEKIIGND